jgi:hypothetical protein
MPTIKDFFTACGLNVPHDRIKLIRHSDHLGRSIRKIIADGWFDAYQAEQSPDVNPFHKCDVIFSFVGVEGNQAEFHGAYRVLDCREFQKGDFAGAPEYLTLPHRDGKSRIWYQLEEMPEFLSLRGRVIAQWVSTRGRFQTKDLELFEVLPPGNQVRFPGYQDVVLTWAELQDIFATPRLHRDWKVALSSSAGIYRIVDHRKGGGIYIGAAYGVDGIWGRWSNYARTGHGGNKMLIPLDPSYFQWSIVRTLSGSMSEKEVIHVERIEMRKHGSRAVGLNH